MQKELKYELYHQYLQHNITDAKRKAEKELQAIETIRESWGGASLKKSFVGWRTWVRTKHRRERRDLRHHWRQVLRGFEAAMESVLIAEAQALQWDRCADVYSDHIFYTHQITGDISWVQPTIATYLPPGFVVPKPPDPLPPGISIDTSSESERDDSPKKTRKKSAKKESNSASNIGSDNDNDYVIY